MARYIDAEKLENDIIGQLVEKTHYHPIMRDSLFMFIKILRNEPTADVEEVVHCRDCDVPHNKFTGCPKLNGLIPPPNYYCAGGERK